MNFHFSSLQSTSHTCSECFWRSSSEIQHTYNNRIAIVDITYINTSFFILFNSNTFRESHCLSFNSILRVHSSDWFYTGTCRLNNWERTILIIFKFFNCNTTTETSTLRKFTCMVEEIRMSLEISNATMICETACI